MYIALIMYRTIVLYSSLRTPVENIVQRIPSGDLGTTLYKFVGHFL